MAHIIPKRYTLYTPFTSPELYNPSPDISENKIRSLFLSSDKNLTPLILTDYFNLIIESVFEDTEPAKLSCLNNYHIYYDPYLQWSSRFSNYIATTLIRQDQIAINGSLLTDSISGSVVIFGSINPSTHLIDQKSYSVPYEIIEQSLRIYESYTPQNQSL